MTKPYGRGDLIMNWHYIKNGELPKNSDDVWVAYVYYGHRRVTKAHWDKYAKNWREYARYISNEVENVYAWAEICDPEPPEEI